MDGGSNGSKDVKELVAGLRQAFATGRTRPLAFRHRQLERLAALVRENEPRILAALREDLRKHAFEGWLAETGFLMSEIRHAQKHLDEWARPEKVKTSLASMPGKSRIVREPLGVVLIIGPWNYPVQLVLAPLIAAISAGNCALIKPSELTPASSSILAELVPRYLDRECYRVVEGGVSETQAILEERFDLVFFTGSTSVGRIVAQAAAKHLTPVVLELGGKCPAIVDRDVDLEVAARRIAWAKFFNAGQTCLAVDYVLVDRSIEDLFVHRIEATIREFYGDDPKESPDFPRIVNARHHARLAGLLDSGDVVRGGDVDKDSLYVAPTVLRNVSPDSKIMQDEIFGPILPVLSVQGIDEAIDFVNARPKPLGLYVFTKDRDAASRVLDRTSSGGACVNDAAVHFGEPELPFGGVGPSGTGAYHGRFGFDAMSHKKAVLDKSTMVDPALRYPPYTEGKTKWAKRLV